MRADVIGAGKSGQAAARVLKGQAIAVTLWDRGRTEALSVLSRLLESEGITVKLGTDYSPQGEVELVVVSPGVPWDHPGLIEARRLGVRTIGEVQLGWEQLGERPWLCVTGTNGKTTTTALLARIFAEAGLDAPECGNIGRPVSDLVLAGAVPDWVVAELSSFQIESSEALRPEIALWTTFTPDHLNRHGTLERYASIKNSLLVHARTAIVNGDDPYLRHRLPEWPERLWTSTTEPQATAHLSAGQIVLRGQPLMATREVQLIGRHNLQNVLMAVLAADCAGIARPHIRAAVSSFCGVPHRLEPVGSYGGITFINDSKATNYDAAQVGLEAVGAPTVLICGGQAKAGEPGLWLDAISRFCTGVVLMGEASALFAEWLRERRFTPVQETGTLDCAVDTALELARKTGATRVLLSPACASYDQFENFEERGQRFTALVAALRPRLSR